MTWIDGSKIYKKTIDFGSLPNSSNKKVAHGINNLKYVLDWFGMTTYSGDTTFRPLPKPNTQVSVLSYSLVEFEPQYVVIYAGDDKRSFSAIITMYYTKTS